MPITITPGDNDNNHDKSGRKEFSYCQFSVDELLDERNYLKKNNFNYSKVDKELKSRFS